MLLAAGAAAQQIPVVAIAPPSAGSPRLMEAGLLMQAEASSWLAATHHDELHVKQILRALERHRIELAQLADPRLAQRARSVLGSLLFVFARSSRRRTARLLEVNGLGADGLPSQVTLPANLVGAVNGGALALEQVVAQAEHAAAPVKRASSASSEAALAAYASCYAILIRQPISVEAPTLLGAVELAQAVKSCRSQAAKADDKFEDAWAALGLALAISGDDAEAVKALLHVHGEHVPLYWLGRYWLVTRYQSPDAGLQALRQSLVSNPGFLLARGYVAEHLMAVGKNSDALDAWREYSKLLPKSAFLRGRVSATLARLGRHDEAIAAAQEGLAIDRSDRDAILELGSRFLDAGKRHQAIATLETAADGNSRRAAAAAGLGLPGQGRLRARRGVPPRRAGDPSVRVANAGGARDLARVYDGRGDGPSAERAMRRALDEEPAPICTRSATSAWWSWSSTSRKTRRRR